MDRSGLPRLGFLGTGVVATALAQALEAAGYRVVAVHGRAASRTEQLAKSLHSARAAGSRQEVVDAADVVFVAVPDDAIASVAESVIWRSEQAAVHCNGAASLDPLAAASCAGAEVGVFHPLQSFANVEQARRLIPGSAFRVEASGDDLRQRLDGMARAIGGHPFSLRGGDPTLYHVSAVLASNYLVTLLHLAAELWERLGMSREEGLQALVPLVEGTLENVRLLGTPRALTGPVARGDVGTIERHVSALRHVAPQLVPVYKELAVQTVALALDKGTIGAHEAGRIETALDALGGEESECA